MPAPKPVYTPAQLVQIIQAKLKEERDAKKDSAQEN
jgi:hypothetical protein